MNYCIYLLAYRFARGIHFPSSTATLVALSIVSIGVGTFCVITSILVMNGFEKATYQKLQGIHAQVILHGNGNLLDGPRVETILKNEFPAIQAFSPTHFKQIALRNTQNGLTSAIITLKAIDPARESAVTTLLKTIENKDKDASFTDQYLIIGNKLAHSLSLHAQDPIEIFFIPDLSDEDTTITKIVARVGGIFTTGMEEYDSTFALASFDLLEKMYQSTEISQYNIVLKPDQDEKKILHQLRERFNLEAQSWKDLYPSVIAALTLEKYAMIIIFFLIMLVASTSIISLLYMQINKKQREIAVLLAMGMPQKHITSLFMAFGLLISVSGVLIGTIAALLGGLILRWHPISLPDSYYVSTLPVCFDWPFIIGILIFILLLCTLSCWLSCRKIKAIECAAILRQHH